MSRSSRLDRRACRSRCTCSVRTCRRARGTFPSSRVRSNPVRRRRDTYIPAWRSPSRPSPPSTRSARPPTVASSAAVADRAGFLWAIKGYIAIHNSRWRAIIGKSLFYAANATARFPLVIHARICAFVKRIAMCPFPTQVISWGKKVTRSEQVMRQLR